MRHPIHIFSSYKRTACRISYHFIGTIQRPRHYNDGTGESRQESSDVDSTALNHYTSVHTQQFLFNKLTE